MNLTKAIHLIAEQEIRLLSSAERANILVSDWWCLDTDSYEFRKLPQAVRNEILNEDTPRLPDAPLYDALLVKSLEYQYRGVRKEYIKQILARLGLADVTITGREATLFVCLCCCYRTLSRRGEYEICPVCFWEDVGDCADDQYVSVNHMTLVEARQNFAAFGACDPSSIRQVDPHGAEKYYRAETCPSK